MTPYEMSSRNIKNLYNKSGYTLHEVFPFHSNPNKPEKYRIFVKQTCPNGHTFSRRWRGSITCGECSKQGFRINKLGEYISDKEAKEVNVTGFILPGVEMKRKKGDVLSLRYNPKKAPLRLSIMMKLFKLIGIKVEKINVGGQYES